MAGKSFDSGGTMRLLLCVLILTAVTGCVSEDSGVVAARMEAQDDASCRQLATGKGEAGYAQCRQNLMAYRQQAQIERAQSEERAERIGRALQNAGAALQSIN
jgi:hypothetical protein